MKTIVQLSDLHFGAVDTRLLDPLRVSVEALAPDVTVISGDLTQRAKPEQFAQARSFLESLPMPQLVIPGNHDIPLYNVAARAFSGLSRYKTFISDDLAPVYIDDAVVIVGVNTARSFTLTNGRINNQQIAHVATHFKKAHPDAVRIVVSHHPFDFTDALLDRWLVRRAPKAVSSFASQRVDVLLGGHFHLSYVGDTKKRYAQHAPHALVVAAGSATSTRQRGEPNSFNVLRIFSNKIAIERHAWRPEEHAFVPNGLWYFMRTKDGWKHTPVPED
jgi:3',5'-cyclic AMP phosphodiesterase CpdA